MNGNLLKTRVSDICVKRIRINPKLIHHNQSHAIAYNTALVGTKLACFAIMINCSRFLIVIWSKNEHTFFKTVIGLLVVKVDWVLRYILGVDFDF